MLCFSSLGTPHVVDSEYKKGSTVFTVFSQIPPVISHNPKLFITQHESFVKYITVPNIQKKKTPKIKTTENKPTEWWNHTIRFQEDTNLKRDDQALAVGEG